MIDESLYQEIQDIVGRFMYLNKTAHEMLCTKTNECMLSPQQFYLLNIIHENDNLNQKIIAEKMRITPATLSVRINRLEKAGFLIRQIDKNDKRNFVLKTTPLGDELIKNSHQFIKRNISLMFEGVTKKELDSLKSCFEMIQHNLDRKKEEFDVKD